MKNHQLNKTIELFDKIVVSTNEYTKLQDKNARKSKGQFFTSPRIARFMAKSVSIPAKEDIRILDPGAGNGLLSVAVLERLLRKRRIRSVRITFIENDPDIAKMLKKVKKQLDAISNLGPIQIACDIKEVNFITTKLKGGYDIIISNPPYFKLSKASEEALCMAEYVYGQPNIYALFTIKALQLLEDNGSYIFITPRSWTSGDYFLKMRRYIIENFTLSRVHLFDVRDDVFEAESVLQETVIWGGTKRKSSFKCKTKISTSTNGAFAKYDEFTVPAHEIVMRTKTRSTILLPMNISDYVLSKKIRDEKETFYSLCSVLCAWCRIVIHRRHF